MKEDPSHFGASGQRRLDPNVLDAMVVEALTFVAGDPESLGRFFDLTGLTPQSLRQAAETPDFGANLLDYLCSEERMLRFFAAQHGYDPADVDAARIALAGPPAADG